MYPLNGIRLVNMYGITETTIHVTHYTLRDEDITAPAALSPIGVPLPETTVYIFNAYLKLQPALVTGELYVGGSGVSRGYLNNSKLTHSRFPENPYKNRRDTLSHRGPWPVAAGWKYPICWSDGPPGADKGISY